MIKGYAKSTKSKNSCRCHFNASGNRSTIEIGCTNSSRALSYVNGGRCELISRKGNRLNGFDALCDDIAPPIPPPRAPTPIPQVKVKGDTPVLLLCVSKSVQENRNVPFEPFHRFWRDDLLSGLF